MVEMRKFCFVLVDERIKAELDSFQALPAQARHSIAQTKVTQEGPGVLWACLVPMQPVGPNGTQRHFSRSFVPLQV